MSLCSKSRKAHKGNSQNISCPVPCALQQSACLCLFRPIVDREKVVTFLDENNVHTRMLFAGNIIKQPMFIGLDKNKYRVASDLKNTDRIMEKTVFLGSAAAVLS